LPDGDNEVLGAWTASKSDGPAWNKVFEELADRGVERIEFVGVGGLALAERALRDEYPNAITLPPEMDRGTLTLGVNARTPVTSFAMSAGHYRKFVVADEVVQNLQRLACRAIERHGSFFGPTGATAFVLDRLHRANQKTDVGFVPYGVASEVLTGPSTRRRRGARIEAPSL
jgi:Transposase, Mutator family